MVNKLVCSLIEFVIYCLSWKYSIKFLYIVYRSKVYLYCLLLMFMQTELSLLWAGINDWSVYIIQQCVTSTAKWISKSIIQFDIIFENYVYLMYVNFIRSFFFEHDVFLSEQGLPWFHDFLYWFYGQLFLVAHWRMSFFILFWSSMTQIVFYVILLLFVYYYMAMFVQKLMGG